MTPEQERAYCWDKARRILARRTKPITQSELANILEHERAAVRTECAKKAALQGDNG